MFDEIELAGLSYRNLQILAAQHRVPGNIKKHAMIKVIIAARNGDDTEVTRLLNELQQTRKKRVQKIKKERKVTDKTASIRSTNYRENRYYAHQQKTFRCATNLQITAEEELTNAVDDHATIPNCEDVHEYLVRVQRDYHFNFNNNMERIHGSPSIVDLRMNEQKTIVHQSLPLDLHRTTNILLSSDQSHQNDADGLTYNFFNANDAIQRPLLLKKMLQAPIGTNLKDIASPDGVYRIFSQNDFAINNFREDSDTLSAESGSNHDDIDNVEDSYEYALNAGESQFINLEHNENSGIQQLNSMDPLILNENDPYRIIYHDTQQTLPKFMQVNNTPLNNSSMLPTGQGDTGMFKTMYYLNENPTQEHVNMQTNQLHYQVNNYPMMTNNYEITNGTWVDSPNSSHCNTYNYQTANHIATHANINMHHNQDNIHCNNQNRSENTNDYYSQSGNSHEPGIFTGIYSDVAVLSQEFNETDADIGHVTALDNSNVINDECATNGYNFHQNIYPIDSQIDFSVNHDDRGSISINNQNAPQKKHSEFYNVDESQTMINNGDLGPYFPHWKQASTPAPGGNLENLLNICKQTESGLAKIDETSTVFCYSPPIVTPKQLNTNANVCTQEKRFFVENRGGTALKTNSSQVYNDTAQGLRMANPIDDLNLDAHFSRNDQNYGLDDPNDMSGTNDNLGASWALDYSNICCDVQSKVTE